MSRHGKARLGAALVAALVALALGPLLADAPSEALARSEVSLVAEGCVGLGGALDVEADLD